MRRVHIAIGAVIVVAGFALFYIVRSGDDDDGEKREKARASDTEGGDETRDDPGDRTAQQPPVDPSDRRADEVDAGGSEFETIAKDGSRVRDYRGRDIQRDPNAEVNVPLKVKKIEPGLMSKLGLKLRGVAKRCKSEHAGDVPENSRVQPRVTFSVKEDRLTIDETELALTNVAEDSGFQSCMRSAIIGLSIEAPAHAVVAAHKMAVPIDLDKL